MMKDKHRQEKQRFARKIQYILHNIRCFDVTGWPALQCTRAKVKKNKGKTRCVTVTQSLRRPLHGEHKSSYPPSFGGTGDPQSSTRRFPVTSM
jgi:hypothetical protein